MWWSETNIKAATIAAIFLLMSCGILLHSEDSDAAELFTVTDGTGREFSFTGAAEHIVSGGTGATLTIADAGALSKIVAADKYSFDTAKYPQLEGISATDLKSFYGTTNHEYIKTTLVTMYEDGKLNLYDPIILTSYSTNEALRTSLESAGFTKVLV